MTYVLTRAVKNKTLFRRTKNEEKNPRSNDISGGRFFVYLKKSPGWDTAGGEIFSDIEENPRAEENPGGRSPKNPPSKDPTPFQHCVHPVRLVERNRHSHSRKIETDMYR